LDGTVKIIDFGLAKIVENASVDSSEAYVMSGETGSLRYMAPEVADALPYNWGADVYSFGIILWELNASKKPYEGLNRELFYERVVHGGERPVLNRKWPQELTALISACWDADMRNRPPFRDVVDRLDLMLEKEKGGTRGASSGSKKPFFKVTGMIDRHSTWF
jgi:serine/threonine protein kinase